MSLLDKYRKRKETIKTSFDDIWVKLENGDNYLRFIANPTDGGFYTQGLKHDHLDLLGSSKVTVLCGRSFKEGAKSKGVCPICELLEEMAKEKDPTSLDIVKKCQARVRCFAYVYVLNSPTDTKPAEPSPKILSFGAKIEEGLLSIYLDPDYGDFTDLKTGRTITIVKSGKGRDTSYSILPKPKPSAFICDLTDLKPIEEVIPPRDYNTLKSYLLGEEKPSEEEEDEAPTKGSVLDTEDETDEELPFKSKQDDEPVKKTTVKAKAKPACFGDGETFSPKSPECKECSFADKCKEIFLSF